MKFINSSYFLLFFLFMLVMATRMQRAWALPLASLILVAAFYAVAAFKGASLEELVATGWLFDIPAEGGALKLLEGVSFSQVDTAFVLSVMPEIVTIAFLALLTQSMSLTTPSSSKATA